MSGFPKRATTINAFGPELENAGPIRSPKRHLSATILNLMRFQLAGMGLVVPRAVLQVSMTGIGSTPVIVTAQQFLTWDSAGVVPLVTWVRNSAGKYTWTFSAGHYPDENGNSVSLDWIGGTALPSKVSSGNHVIVGTARIDSSTSGQALLEDVNGAFSDPVGVGGTAGTFLLLLW